MCYYCRPPSVHREIYMNGNAANTHTDLPAAAISAIGTGFSGNGGGRYMSNNGGGIKRPLDDNGGGVGGHMHQRKMPNSEFMSRSQIQSSNQSLGKKSG